MAAVDYLKFLQENIHTTVVATADENGLPVTCAIDMMDYDENSLYFLTAKGKDFYDRLKNNSYIALTGIADKDTMSCIAVSLGGRVRELGPRRLPKLFGKNPYMNEIYPEEQTRSASTVFLIYEGRGERFDLSQTPLCD